MQLAGIQRRRQIVTVLDLQEFDRDGELAMQLAGIRWRRQIVTVLDLQELDRGRELAMQLELKTCAEEACYLWEDT